MNDKTPIRHNSLRDFDPIIRAKIGIYVYALIDPRDGRIFYVGKGGGKEDSDGNSRLFSHFDEAERCDRTSGKLEVIRDIWRSGQDVKWHILRHSLSSPEEAFHVEAAVIDALKLSKNGETNNDVAGHGGDAHGSKGPEVILAMAAQPAKPTQSCRVFLFSIYKALKIWEGTHPRPEAIYESTRKCWSLGKKTDCKLPMFGVGLVDGESPRLP